MLSKSSASIRVKADLGAGGGGVAHYNLLILPVPLIGGSSTNPLSKHYNRVSSLDKPIDMVNIIGNAKFVYPCPNPIRESLVPHAMKSNFSFCLAAAPPSGTACYWDRCSELKK